MIPRLCIDREPPSPRKRTKTYKENFENLKKMMGSANVEKIIVKARVKTWARLDTNTVINPL